MNSYKDYIEQNGNSLSEINPGSDERALQPKHAFEAVELVRMAGKAILGGDIMVMSSEGKLIYAYQFWGPEYQYLNWYCIPLEDEAYESFLKNSVQVALRGINDAVQIANKLNSNCYIVLVVDNEDD